MPLPLVDNDLAKNVNGLPPEERERRQNDVDSHRKILEKIDAQSPFAPKAIAHPQNNRVKDSISTSCSQNSTMMECLKRIAGSVGQKE